MERARWNTELSYKKLNFESVQLFGVTPYCYHFTGTMIPIVPIPHPKIHLTVVVLPSGTSSWH